MKRQLLGLSVLAAVMAQPVSAVTLYGKANVSLQHADEAGNREIELQSNSSRIGLMGSESISDSFEVVYRLEYETSVDDGDKDGQTLTQRNIYLGLQTDYGTVLGGVFDTPLKTSASGIDLFNDLEGDIKNIFAGEIRSKNIVQYVTPKSFGPVTAKVAYITKEIDGIDGVSSSVAYKTEDLYLALAFDNDVEESGSNTDTYRIIGAFNIGPVQLGGAYESYEREADDGDGYFGSVKWKITDKWIFKTQYGQSDIKVNGRESFSIGGDYKFSKITKAYAYFTQNDDDAGRDDDYLGVGMEIKF
ncbi:porin [Gilvimarinus sp. SDUM040013]|uniref:Porin n=1 Tax=Gilvimarinus gilvus TaxID=3058038 RepID=A0ABU4RVG3_9GAMM|nr:porin [Gilvimarinus sp. SDUM040013]MDO3386959.1 porin [Gilvimarinus sp. SDUM040013]MDX6848147.1 porin [Gilvimarinus sp. SDUM040013]